MSSKENNTQRVPEEIKKDDIGYSERFHDPPLGDGKMGETTPLSKSAPTGGNWDEYMDKASSSKMHRRSGSSDMKKNQPPKEAMLKRHPRGERNSNYFPDDPFIRDSDHPPAPMHHHHHHPAFRVDHLTHQDIQAILMENYNLRGDLNAMQHQFRVERMELQRRLKHAMARLHYLEDRKYGIPDYNDPNKPFPPPPPQQRKGYRSSRPPPLGPPLNRTPLAHKDSTSDSYNIQPPQEAYKESRVTGNEQNYAPESPEPIMHSDLNNNNGTGNGRKEDMRRRSFSEDKQDPYRYGKSYYDMSPQDRLTDYDPELMYGPRKMYPYPYDQDEFYDGEDYSSEEEFSKRPMRGPPMHSLPPMSMMGPPPPPPPMPPIGYPPPPPQQQGGWMLEDIPYGDPRGQMMGPPPPLPPPGSIHRSSSKRSQLSRHSSNRKPPMTAEEEDEMMMMQQQEQQFGEEDDPEVEMLMQQMSMGQPPPPPPPMGRYPQMMRADMYMMGGGSRMPPPPPPPPPMHPGPPMMDNLMYDEFGPSSIRRVPSHRSVPGGSTRSSYLGSR